MPSDKDIVVEARERLDVIPFHFNESDAKLIYDLAEEVERLRGRESIISELNVLRKEYELSGLGDRPQSISAAKLKRLIDLEGAEKASREMTIDPRWSLARQIAGELDRQALLYASRGDRALTNDELAPAYKTVVVDPPWQPELGQSWRSRLRDKAGPQRFYPTLTLEQIISLRPCLADQAHLYIWCVAAHADWGFDLARAWVHHRALICTLDASARDGSYGGMK